MEIVEKRRPQDGRIKTLTPDGDEVELRISTMPTAFGEKLVMRIFTPEVLVRDFTDLGFTHDDRERWERMIKRAERHHPRHRPDGLGQDDHALLVAEAARDARGQRLHDRGPDRDDRARCSTRCRCSRSIGVDFATGVRTLMRQDPDIIMVGEIRDRDTADMAVQAALTGPPRAVDAAHQRRAHGGDAAARPRRAAVPPDQLDAARRDGAAPGAHAVPALQEAGASRPTTRRGASMTAPWRADKPAQVMAPVGCLECRMTGYRGRIGLYEIMLMTPALRRLDHARRQTTGRMREQAYKDGMKPLRVSGAMKVAAGLTTAEEVMKVAPLALKRARQIGDCRNPLGRHELQRHAVVAIALARRLGPVVEHVALVAFAAAAVVLGARRDELVVDLGGDGARNRRVEARPAGAALELGVGLEERQRRSRRKRTCPCASRC